MIYRHFDDFVLQKYQIADMTIYALILTNFGNEKFPLYSLFSYIKCNFKHSGWERKSQEIITSIAAKFDNLFKNIILTIWCPYALILTIFGNEKCTTLSFVFALQLFLLQN